MGGVCFNPNRVVEIEGGTGFTCARLLGGTVYCWGVNSSRQLDDGTTMTRYVATGPTRSTDPRMMANDAVDLSVGTDHACIVRRNGRVHCWGLNSYRQLGDGSATDVEQVAAGGTFTCAVRAPSGMPRHVVCWGDNYSHQLGTTGITETSTPVRVMGTDGAVQVTAGGEFACARLETGSVVCWGSNSQGQLGRGSTTPSSSEVPMAVPLAGSAVDIDAGYHFACAALTTGAVQCWGNNVWGQLGDEMAVTPTTTPVTARSLTGVVEVAAGQNHTCARTMGGAVTCWGDNRHGQLGDGTTMRRMSPGASISGLMAVDIAAGYDHSCAVRSGGPPQCWGGNDTGQIGNGDSSRANVLSPTDVMGLP
jgi:alpha-tubulin suppressor-like RCC1 family protein